MNAGAITGTATWRRYDEARRPEALGRLLPLRPQPLERGRDQDHHHRDLEVDVDEPDTEQRGDVEAVRIEVDADVC